MNHEFTFTTKLNSLERSVTNLPNPEYKEMINKYNHWGSIQTDVGAKNLLPINNTLRASNCAKIKKEICPRLGQKSDLNK